MSAATTNTTIESIASTFDSPDDEYIRWQGEIALAEKEFKDYWSKCKKILARYADTRTEYDKEQRKFNIFAANVDSVASAVYSTPPKVEVNRRFNDEDDDVSRIAALILERTLSQDLDEPGNEFHDVLKGVVFDRLTSALGQVWLRVEEETEEVVDPMTGLPTKVVRDREVVIDHVHYSDFLYSPCRIYSERRWVARRVKMDRDSLLRRFGSKVGSAVPLSENYSKTRDEDHVQPNEILRTAVVYEIWDRERKEVIWYNKGYPKLLDKMDDYLHLSTFEPCPPPLFGSITTTKCIPITDYEKCQDQYEELNTVNNRISSLIDACLVRGLYDKTEPAIPRLMTEGRNNMLIPVANWNTFKEKGGLTSAVEWMPLDAIVSAIAVLRQEKEAKKQEVFELSGYSDIMRGATKATETATAQQLKANFSSSKVQKLQNDVEGFVRNTLFIKAEIIAKHFEPNYLLEISNIQQVEQNPSLLQAAIQLIQNPLRREYALAIKPDSMAQADYQSEKSDRMELLTVVGNYMEKAFPIISSQPILADLIVGMLKFGVAGFKAGKEFESILDNGMTKIQQFQQQQSQQPPPPDPAMLKAQADMQAKQMDMQAKSTQQNMEIQKMRMEHNLALQRQQSELQFAQQRNAMDLHHKAQMMATQLHEARDD